MKIQTLKNIANVYISFLTNKSKIRPKRAGWYITDTCNARCIKCDIWKTEPKNSKDLTLENNQKIIDNLSSFGIDNLDIVGGEPFCFPHIFELIDYACKKDIKVELNTNGLALNKERIDKLLRIGVYRLGFSVDGVNPSTHDKIIGIKGAYVKLTKNIRYYTSKGGVGHMSSLISAINADELIDLYHLAQKIGLDGIIYQPFQYVPAFISDKKKEELSYEKYIKKIDNVLNKLIKLKKNNDFTIYNSVPYIKKVKHFIRNEKMPNFCFAPYCHIIIDNQGNLVPCTAYRKKLGSLVEIPLEKLWNSKEYIKTRKWLKKAGTDAKAKAANKALFLLPLNSLTKK